MKKIKLTSNNIIIIISSLLLIIMLFMFFFGPYILKKSPTDMDYSNLLMSPSDNYLLGTDNFGRGILIRIMYGGRISLIVATFSSLLALIVGLFFGLTAGYYGKKIGYIIMRGMDFLISFPPILMAIFVVGLFGGSLVNLILVIGILYVPRIARLSYSQCLSIKESEYIESMRALGAIDLRIIFKGIIPNLMGPVIVQTSIIFAYSLLLESGLSFLGLGVKPPNPTLGGMISEGRSYIHVTINPVFWPSLFLSLLVLSANLLSESLREKFDPAH